LTGSLDGAADALRPVLTLPSDQRIAQLSERLTGVRRTLARQRGAAREVRDLDEHIEHFVTTATVPQLPSTPTST
jgi:hypothetical protein